MRLSKATSARMTVAVAALLAAAVGGSGVAVSAATTTSDPETFTVQPAVNQVHGTFMTPVPFSDAQCEATFQIQCYVPDQVEAAYNLPALYRSGITGKGQTIVIVDAFGSPTIADDLLQFDQYLAVVC